MVIFKSQVLKTEGALPIFIGNVFISQHKPPDLQRAYVQTNPFGVWSTHHEWDFPSAGYIHPFGYFNYNVISLGIY